MENKRINLKEAILSDTGELLKECNACHQLLPLSSFSKSKTGRMGVQYRCKLCYKKYREENAVHIKERKKQWVINNHSKVLENKRERYRKNAKKIIQQNSKWSEEHPERRRETVAEWRRLNPDKVKAIRNTYRGRNKEKLLEKSRQYRIKNRDKLLKIQRENYYTDRDRSIEAAMNWKRNNRERATEIQNRRRARKITTQVEKINPIIIFERDNWICGICGEPVDMELVGKNPMAKSLDHIIPLSRGGSHTVDNVQLAHFSCNMRKGNAIIKKTS
jgi:hypothetical protein